MAHVVSHRKGLFYGAASIIKHDDYFPCGQRGKQGIKPGASDFKPNAVFATALPPIDRTKVVTPFYYNTLLHVSVPSLCFSGENA